MIACNYFMLSKVIWAAVKDIKPSGKFVFLDDESSPQ